MEQEFVLEKGTRENLPMNTKRWSMAQSYEKSYWENIAKKIAADADQQLTWYEWKAGEFDKKLDQIDFRGRSPECRILEVGSGPMGIVSYLKWGSKVALDPLGDFYAKNRELVELRNGTVQYVTGSGEHIPYPDGHFDIVIIDNVLDHVCSPDQVVREIRRVLNNAGHLYLELNIHTYWGYLLHSLLASLKIDKGHPYSFTREKIRAFLESNGWRINKEWQNSYREARDLDRKSDSIKAKIKGYSGLSEFVYFSLCQKG